MTDTDISPNLGLPFYQTKQNEFEVQHNEALSMLDALVMLAVIDRDLSAPPSSPSVGDRYLVKATGTGDFAGNDNRIAQYDTGGWNFYAPHAGWTCYVQDEGALLAWSGTSWEPALDVLGGMAELQNISLLGIGTTADSTNPMSAKLNNALWTAKTAAEGGDGSLRYKLSKENAAGTLSFLFQDDFSGRAEIGLTGDDDFHFKVSADGTAWRDAIVIDRTTGKVSLPLSSLDITIGELAISLADALNVAQFLGSSGNRFADSFDATTYVDTGGATNLDSGTAGQLKPTVTANVLISQAAGTAIGNLTSQGGLAAAFDGNNNQSTSTSAFNTNSASAGTLGKDWGSGVTHIVSQAKVYGPNNAGILRDVTNTAANGTLKLQGSNDNSTWTDLGSAASGTASSAVITITSSSVVAYRYHRVYFPAVDSSTDQCAAELEFYADTVANLTVASVALTAASAPTTMKVVALVEEVYSVTLNTDLIFLMSRDGGTTWTTAAMNDRFTANAIHALESDPIDVSGQPSGASVKWKIETANNKLLKIHGIYVYWS